MHIVFDMDNTLTDEFGQKIRPCIMELLKRLIKEGHKLSVWTSSTRDRAHLILDTLKIRTYFKEVICREDYDPNNKDIGKDIRKISGDILVDDDPKQIRYVKSINRKGYLIEPFRVGRSVDNEELVSLIKQIKKENGFFKKVFGSLYGSI